MRTLTTFLKDNPEIRSKYVAVGVALGVALVDTAVGSLNKLMHHLFEVQGIDPRTQPGDKFRKALTDYMDRIEDAEEFEDDFDPINHIPDFSPVARAFKRAQGKLSALLSVDQYNKATDLTHVNDKPAPEWLKPTKVWGPPKDEHDNAIEELQKFMDKYNVSMTPVPVTTGQMKKILDVLKKYRKLNLTPKLLKALVKTLLLEGSKSNLNAN